MRKTFMYLVGGHLATISIPLMAQEPVPKSIPDAVGGGTLTPDQMTAYDSWPEERKATYDAWPTDAQAYFWTLTPDRQEVFWMLRDEDKLAVVAMDDTAREEAWAVIESRLETATPPPMEPDEPTEPVEPDEPAEPVDPQTL